MKKHVIAVPLIFTTILMLLSACAPGAMNTKSSLDMEVAPESGENAHLAPIDIDENVYQHGATDDAALMTTADHAAKTNKPSQSKLDDALELCHASQEYWQRGELENAVESLDQAYALILDVEALDDFKLIQEKEDLRFMISKRILEIYASRHIVVNGNHNAIPLEMNRHVEAEIKRFTVGPEKKFFLKSIAEVFNSIAFGLLGERFTGH